MMVVASKASSWWQGMRHAVTPGRAILVIMVLMAAAPLVVPGYYASDVLARAALLAILALSLDLAWGRTGILSLGHSAFFGIGAYAMAIVLMRWDSAWAPVTGMILAILLPAVLAAIVGLFVFSGATNPLFVSIVTLSLPVLLSAIVLRVPELTGGLTGLSGVPMFPWYEPLFSYYFVLAALALALFGVYRLAASDFGRMLTAVRDNEERARFLGYDTSRIQLVSFATSAGVAGFAGGLYAPYNGFVSSNLVGLVLSTSAIVWVATGGRGTIVGPLIGALLVNIAEPSLNASFPGTWQLLLGLSFIVVILAFPSGLFGLIGRGRIGREFKTASFEPLDQDLDRLPEIKISDLRLSFGALHVLRGIDLQIRSGTLHILIGPNGAGKSTLINAITGRLRSSSGTITTGQARLDDLPSHKIVKAGIIRTYQSSNVFDTLSVGDNLRLAAGPAGATARARNPSSVVLPSFCQSLIEQSGLGQLLTTTAGELSHGQRKWLELCMVLAARPAILLLDEPTAGLAVTDRKKVGEVLQSLVKDYGIGLLIVEHDVEFVRNISERLTVLSDGIILADGDVDAVLADKRVQEVYIGRPADLVAREG